MLNPALDMPTADAICVVSSGAGTGGLTKQIAPMLQASLHQAPLVKYVATDVSAAFGPALQTAVGISEFDFKVNGIKDC
jgi:hypothetical protein